ncbi:hypothetical protein A2U01_0003053 [Trifolium medium]|uniref:Uncharacterized protein n=1 Tax=Trifolium medium TaxID=97028 RepID=A0A392M4D0_9FABA|nr:hypothetical protein [Trifolium medium]
MKTMKYQYPYPYGTPMDISGDELKPRQRSMKKKFETSNNFTKSRAKKAFELYKKVLVVGLHKFVGMFYVVDGSLVAGILVLVSSIVGTHILLYCLVQQNVFYCCVMPRLDNKQSGRRNLEYACL